MSKHLATVERTKRKRLPFNRINQTQGGNLSTGWGVRKAKKANHRETESVCICIDSKSLGNLAQVFQKMYLVWWRWGLVPNVQCMLNWVVN